MTSMDKRTRGLTRRAAAAAAVAAPLAAQGAQGKSADQLEAARTQTQRSIDALRKFRTPTLLEPSFAFRP
jgi:hypothetical protein